MMAKVLWRTSLAAALLAGGIGSLIYGAMSHHAPVTEEQVREIEIPIPGPPGLGAPPFQPPGSGPPGMPAGMGPPEGPAPGFPPLMRTIKEKVKVLVTRPEPELVLIQEVTVGGVTRLDSGRLMRTYTGQPPSLCPT